jgi:NDP-sugar pyrophosphorylase family protein
MKAMVLAAGLGTRLGALTANKPKCLMPVGGHTLISLVLSRLKAAGVQTAVVNLFHCADAVRAYLEQNAGFGLAIEFSPEKELLGTGGGIKGAKRFLFNEANFFIHNSDVYSEIDLKAFWDFHRAQGALASLAVMQRKTSRYLLFDHNDELVGWENLSTNKRKLLRSVENPKQYAFCGVHVAGARLFDYMPKDQESFDVITELYLPAIEAGARIKAFDVSTSYWLDVGRPEHLETLRKKLAGF